MGEGSLPRWDMTPVFPGLESEEFSLAFKEAKERIASYAELYDTYGINGGDPLEVDGALVEALETVLSTGNELNESLRTLGAYIASFVSMNSKDNVAQAKYSEFQMETIVLSKLGTRFAAWLTCFDLDAVIGQSAVASEHAFPLRKSARMAAHLMSQPEEDLYSDLTPMGPSAWGRLHSNISSRLLVEVPGKGKLPMSAVRGMAQDPDASVREAAYQAELAAWETVEVPMAAALNSIKGAANVVNARRGWEDAVAPGLFTNNVDRETLDAMQQACVESFPDFRRYMGAKAKLLGKERLAWWDLFAPVGASSKKWSWEEGVRFVVDNFATYSDRLAGLAKRSFDEKWVDAEPREGKADGAFCMGLRKDESRVALNYSYSFNTVSTLAHELGHAYHNLNLAQRTPAQRQTPMALAETASIFCQTIITNAAIAAASDDEKLGILEAELQGACQVVVDIHSRFLLEKGVHEARAKRELSADELSEMILQAQRDTYGDGLDADALHKYMWAVKPHYYGASFYNWPYTFGLLFGIGLYAQYQKDPEPFKAGYDDLLSSTGMADAASLTSRFGFDIRDAAFWRSSLDVLRTRIDEFVKQAG